MNREPYDVAFLHPVMQGPAAALALAMRTKLFKAESGEQFVLHPFEGFRHPRRQHYLLTATKSTKAGPWQSAHQYGLAVDFAGLVVDEGNAVIPNSWTWEVPRTGWVELKRVAAAFGLDVPIAWDQGHVQHPRFDLVRKSYKDV